MVITAPVHTATDHYCCGSKSDPKQCKWGLKVPVVWITFYLFEASIIIFRASIREKVSVLLRIARNIVDGRPIRITSDTDHFQVIVSCEMNEMK